MLEFTVDTEDYMLLSFLKHFIKDHRIEHTLEEKGDHFVVFGIEQDDFHDFLYHYFRIKVDA